MAEEAGWRRLWRAHLLAGGQPWPPGCERDVVGRALLDTLLDGGALGVPLSPLASDLGPALLDHPRRAELWDVLPSELRPGLLDTAAQLALERLKQREFDEPERSLARAIIELVRRRSPSPGVAARLLAWPAAGPEERDLIAWVRELPAQLWESVAVQIGSVVEQRGWEHAAKLLNRRWPQGSAARAGATACASLLPLWLQWVGHSDGAAQEALADRVADLGAELAPHQLGELWERAGGRRKYFSSNDSPQQRWQRACRAAADGALERGLYYIVRELRHAYPNNLELEDLYRVLVRRAP